MEKLLFRDSKKVRYQNEAISGKIEQQFEDSMMNVVKFSFDYGFKSIFY